jgi:hypothetical protein
MDGNGSVHGFEESDGGKLEALRRQFFVEEDLIASRLDALTEKVRRFCTVDKRGNVRVLPEVKSAKNQLQVALAARAVAARLNTEISEAVSVPELSEATGLAKDVVSARCGELVKSRAIDSSRRGTFRIQQDRIERFLDSLVLA